MKILEFLGFLLIVLVVAAGIFLYKAPIPADVVDARYISPDSQFHTMSTGARIHFRDQGKRRGTPIVLIHGSSASLHSFEPWVELLKDDYRLISLDLPGHGLTGAVPDNDYTMDGFLRTVDSLVSHLDLENFTIAGNSMGGHVAWRYTLAYPEKVDRLILVDASGPAAWRQLEPAGDSATEQDSPLAFRLLNLSWFRAVAVRLDPYYLVRQGVEIAYNRSAAVTDDLINRYYEMALREGTPEATMIRFAAAARKPGPAPDLSRIEQPTLILWGREDALINVRIAHRFDRVIPDSTLVIFDDVGHMPMEEIPLESSMALRQFMATADRKSDERPATPGQAAEPR